MSDYKIKPRIADPLADSEDVKKGYGYELSDISTINDADCLVLGVAHDEYVKMGISGLSGLFDKNLDNSEKVIIDVKGILDKKEVKELGFSYWRL